MYQTVMLFFVVFILAADKERSLLNIAAELYNIAVLLKMLTSGNNYHYFEYMYPVIVSVYIFILYYNNTKKYAKDYKGTNIHSIRIKILNSLFFQGFFIEKISAVTW